MEICINVNKPFSSCIFTKRLPAVVRYEAFVFDGTRLGSSHLNPCSDRSPGSPAKEEVRCQRAVIMLLFLLL